MRRSIARVLAVGILVVVGENEALAQGNADAAVRRELLLQAQTAASSNDHRTALDLATRASRVEMTPSVRLFIAQQQQALGLYAEASNNAELCARESERATTVRSREVVLTACRELGEQLRRRVGRVLVALPATPPPGLQILIAGQPLNELFYGVGYIVTPGRVLVEASAPGHRPFRSFVEVTAENTARIELSLERELPRESARPLPSPGFRLSPGALALTSVGAAGFVTTGVLALLRQGAIDSLEKLCDPPQRIRCPEGAAVDTELSRANTFNLATNVALGVSAAVLAGGVTWLFVAGFQRSNPLSPAQTVSVQPLPGGASLTLQGAF